MIYAGMAVQVEGETAPQPVKGHALPDSGGAAVAVIFYVLNGSGEAIPITTDMLPGGVLYTAPTVFAADVGTGAATTIDVTHNLGTRDVIVTVRETASPWEVVYPTVQLLTVNAVRLIFAVAPTSGQYRVVVIGVAVP